MMATHLSLEPATLSLEWNRSSLRSLPVRSAWYTLSWIERRDMDEVYELVKAGQNLPALRILYDLLDEALLRSEFGRCDNALAALDAARLSNACWVGVLGITRAARAQLPSRSGFFRDVEAQLEVRGASAQVRSALRGLA